MNARAFYLVLFVFETCSLDVDQCIQIEWYKNPARDFDPSKLVCAKRSNCPSYLEARTLTVVVLPAVLKPFVMAPQRVLFSTNASQVTERMQWSVLLRSVFQMLAL